MEDVLGSDKTMRFVKRKELGPVPVTFSSNPAIAVTCLMLFIGIFKIKANNILLIDVFIVISPM